MRGFQGLVSDALHMHFPVTGSNPESAKQGFFSRLKAKPVLRGVPLLIRVGAWFTNSDQSLVNSILQTSL